MSEQSWVIPISDLHNGTVLNFDLVDTNGEVLHPAGLAINEGFKVKLASMGVTSVSIMQAPDSSPLRIESILTNSFGSALVDELHRSIETAQNAVSNAIHRLQQRETIDSQQVVRGAESFIETAGKDLAAALATLSTAHLEADSEGIDRLANRSARLSLLGVVTSLSQGQSTDFALEVGLTGMLHDCSLVKYPRLLNHTGDEPLDAADLAAYRRHPIESAELLQHCADIPPRVLSAISQVHEQADGSGFPGGLRLSETVYPAVILNIADAYLTLTDASSPRRIVPSDAIAYLVNHSARGRFCPMTIQTMMRGMSLYPIGTIVLLDDETKAVVVGSNSESPTHPVVRTLNATQQRIDLLHSNRSIAGPYVDTTSGYHRVRKADLNEVFWRLDSLAART